MKVVEVIRTNETDPVILQKGVKWVEEIGKVSVLCDDTPGTFCGELFLRRRFAHDHLGFFFCRHHNCINFSLLSCFFS